MRNIVKQMATKMRTSFKPVGYSLSLRLVLEAGCSIVAAAGGSL